jgi:hypothetical protein
MNSLQYNTRNKVNTTINQVNVAENPPHVRVSVTGALVLN